MKKILSKKINTGITLIALVITIVVLIILATVVINLSLGENGLFNRAREAKEQYSNVQAKEEKELSDIEWQVDVNSRDTVTIPKEDYEKLKNKCSNKFKSSENISLPYTATEPCAVFLRAHTGTAAWQSFYVKINGYTVYSMAGASTYAYGGDVFYLDEGDTISITLPTGGAIDSGPTLYKY